MKAPSAREPAEAAVASPSELNHGLKGQHLPPEKLNADALSKTIPSVAPSSFATASYFPITPRDAPSVSGKGLTETTQLPFSINGNADLEYRVNKLLDVEIKEDFSELATYIDEVVPEFFVRTLGKSAVVNDVESSSHTVEAVVPAPRRSRSRASAVGGTAAAPPLSAFALRSVLQDQVIHTHRAFLHEFKQLYDTFLDAAEHVQTLDRMCTHLAEVANARTQQTEEFVQHIAALEAELQLVDQRDHALKEFRERLNFGPDEQRVLEEEPVGVTFMEALERTRRVHLKSLTFSHLPEYQRSASVVAETTYSAIIKACEKISRYLLFSASSEIFSDEDGRVSKTAIAADIPEVSKLYMHCVQVLREESTPHWEQVMREVAQQRRASVLRRYFHLLTTGSATTSVGTYYRHGARSSTVEESQHGSLKPLEADLDNPVVFFSSLFAWLHQSIVEEEDFLKLFFVSTELEESKKLENEGSSDSIAAATSSSTLTKEALLELVFDAVTKQVRTSLEGILERILRRSLARDKEGTRVVARDRLEAPRKWDDSGAESLHGSFGPRGLTGGLTKIFLAATGRRPSKPAITAAHRGDKKEQDPFTSLLRSNASVSSGTVDYDPMHASFTALQTCFQLLQLFAYYNTTTFEALLGRRASLTEFIAKTAVERLRQVLDRLTKVVTEHLYDSVAGLIGHTLTLRRLPAIHAAAQPLEAVARAATTPSTLHRAAEKRLFVLDFLMKFTLENGMGGNGENTMESSIFGKSGVESVASHNRRMSGGHKDLQQSTSACELEQVLEQQLLAVPPEVNRCLQLLDIVMADTARQQQLLASFFEQRTAARAQREQPTNDTQLSYSGASMDGDKECRAPLQLGELHFTTLIQSLLNLHHLLNQQDVIRRNFDDACQAILESNCFSALCDVLRKHEALLASIPSTLVTASSALPDLKKRGPDQVNSTASALVEAIREGDEQAAKGSHSAPIIAIVEGELQRLHETLKGLFATSAIKFYFMQTNPTCASLMSDLVSFSNSQRQECVKAATAAANLKTFADVRAMMAVLHNLYNLVASSGGLPKLPMLTALADASHREGLQQHVVERVLDAYAYLYAILEHKLLIDSSSDPSYCSAVKLNDDETSIFTDMAPEKLRVLMDV